MTVSLILALPPIAVLLPSLVFMRLRPVKLANQEVRIFGKSGGLQIRRLRVGDLWWLWCPHEELHG